MIYFIQAPDGGLIKIGTTNHMSERLKTIAKREGKGLRVLAVVDGGPPEEKALHGRFSHLRSVGEWFEPGDDLLGFIVTEANEWDGAATKPIRLDLTPETHRRLRFIAACEEKSMAEFCRDYFETYINEQYDKVRKGL